MTLSLCMIVKDEEKVLGRCLDSVAECFDEIIILDTGSTDRTCEIAAQYTTHIYHTTWEDDFAKARNLSFSHATGDYIMWLDADDIMNEANRNRLLALKGRLDGSIDMYRMHYATAYDENDAPTFYYMRERIVKRTTTHHWEGCVHETLQCTGQYEDTDIFIFHKSVKTSYSKRNLSIFERKLSADGYLVPREQFYYARELYYHKQYRKAISLLSSYLLSGLGWIENRIDAHLIISKCHEALGDTKAALNSLFLSFHEAPPRAETCCEIGRFLMTQMRYRDAIPWFQMAMQDISHAADGAFTNTEYLKYIPCLSLCVCFDKLGDAKTAKYYNDMIAAERPNAPPVKHNLAYFASLEPIDSLRNTMN